jgi:serine/threonine-protein kinase HipA
VIERARGTSVELTEIEYLLAAGDDGAGALTFGEVPDAPRVPGGHHRAVALPELLAAAELLDAEGPVTAESRRAAELLLRGVSMGGARPKAVVSDRGALWLAKFPGREDRFNMAAAEAGLLTIAGMCGMRVPEHRTVTISGKPVLMVRRFDRSGAMSAPNRARYLSALTLLDGDELLSPSWSYLLLASELRRRSSAPDDDRRELFRRMAFNALVSNEDDHPRNHAIIAWGIEDWRLSPLFDVVPTARAGVRQRRLALIAGNHGRAGCRQNLVSGAAEFRLSPAEAGTIIDEIRGVLLDQWEGVFRGQGASARDIEALRHAIVPEGFEDPAQE